MFFPIRPRYHDFRSFTGNEFVVKLMIQQFFPFTPQQGFSGGISE
jgi:hypothetical protein